MGTGRTWTKEEISFLIDKWGDMTPTAIANKLNRTEVAIMVKARRLKLGSYLDNSEFISLNKLTSIMGIDYVTLTKILPYRRKQVRKGRYVKVIAIDYLMWWMEVNQDKYDASRIEPNIFGLEPAWLIKKRKEDIEKNKKSNLRKRWTPIEDARLMRLWMSGMCARKIGIEMLRSTASIEHRIQELRKKEKQRRDAQ